MKYYKDKQNQIYAYDDNVSDEFINAKIKELGLIKLSEQEIEELNRPKEPSLDELKQAKLDQILESFNQNTQNLDGGLMIESLNLRVDCGRVHASNASQLLILMQNTGAEKLSFRLFDNTVRDVTLDELKTIHAAIVVAGTQLYTKKWQLEERVKNAKDKKELDEIVW